MSKSKSVKKKKNAGTKDKGPSNNSNTFRDGSKQNGNKTNQVIHNSKRNSETNPNVMILLSLFIVVMAVFFVRSNDSKSSFTPPNTETASQSEKYTNSKSKPVSTTTTTTTTTTSESNHPNQKDYENDPRKIWGKYILLDTIPHDSSAFTQGLTTYKGKLFESTGLYGQSQLRQINPINGEILSSHSLDETYFGEGLTYYQDIHGKDLLLQLTWKEKTGFIYDLSTFDLQKQFTYETTTGQGWGVTYDPTNYQFIVSDGSEWLHFWDCHTLKEVRRLKVTLSQTDTPVKTLNELEYSNGKVLANVWYKDIIVSINIDSGKVDRIIDFKDLYTDRDPNADCFNGISQTEVEDEFLVTGKLWKHMYKIKFI